MSIRAGNKMFFSRGPIPEDEERSSDAAMGGGGCAQRPILRVSKPGRVASAQHVARTVTSFYI